jgi:predicted TIM-barrel enzyme
MKTAMTTPVIFLITGVNVLSEKCAELAQAVASLAGFVRLNRL